MACRWAEMVCVRSLDEKRAPGVSYAGCAVVIPVPMPAASALSKALSGATVVPKVQVTGDGASVRLRVVDLGAPVSELVVLVAAATSFHPLPKGVTPKDLCRQRLISGAAELLSTGDGGKGGVGVGGQGQGQGHGYSKLRSRHAVEHRMLFGAHTLQLHPRLPATPTPASGAKT